MADEEVAVLSDSLCTGKQSLFVSPKRLESKKLALEFSRGMSEGRGHVAPEGADRTLP